MYQFMTNNNDDIEPHADAIQLSSGVSGSMLLGYEIDQNVIFNGDSRGNGLQGIFYNISVGNLSKLVSPKVRGNVIITDIGHGITLKRTSNPLIVGNTMIHLDTTTAALGTGLRLGQGDDGLLDGSAIILSNIAENFFMDAELVTDELFNAQDVGLNGVGADGPYTDLFDGPTFDPQTYAEVLTKYNMKANGAADQDSSGGPTFRDAGTLGTGYATFGNPRDSNGWTLDSSYEKVDGSAPLPVPNNFHKIYEITAQQDEHFTYRAPPAFISGTAP